MTDSPSPNESDELQTPDAAPEKKLSKGDIVVSLIPGVNAIFFWMLVFSADWKRAWKVLLVAISINLPLYIACE